MLGFHFCSLPEGLRLNGADLGGLEVRASYFGLRASPKRYSDLGPTQSPT